MEKTIFEKMELGTSFEKLEEVEEIKEEIGVGHQDGVKEVEIEEVKPLKVFVKRDLLNEMRSLLRNYPLDIKFDGFQTEYDLINNLVLIHDLLIFCRYKSLKEDIKHQITEELTNFEDLNIDKIRKSNLKLRTSSSLRRNKLIKTIRLLIEPHFELIADKIQFYSLAIPQKEKPNMHLRSVHGMPPVSGEEFEAEEISEGENVKEGDSFKVEEGKIVRVD